MVECAALEMQCTGNRTVGSNPTLSAIPIRSIDVLSRHRRFGGGFSCSAFRKSQGCEIRRLATPARHAGSIIVHPMYQC